MSKITNDQLQDKPIIYQIKVKGQLDAGWAEWFDGFKITIVKDGSGSTISILVGSIEDQGALYGIIARLRDLGLTLLEIRPE